MIKCLRKFLKRQKNTEFVPFSMTKYYQAEFRKNVIQASEKPDVYEGTKDINRDIIEPRPNAQFEMKTRQLTKYNMDPE